MIDKIVINSHFQRFRIIPTTSLLQWEPDQKYAQKLSNKIKKTKRLGPKNIIKKQGEQKKKVLAWQEGKENIVIWEVENKKIIRLISARLVTQSSYFVFSIGGTDFNPQILERAFGLFKK